jgi:hypothetical protein
MSIFPHNEEPCRRLVESLPRLQPSLESLTLSAEGRLVPLPPEAAGLSALTTLTSLTINGMNGVGKEDPLPFFAALSALESLDLSYVTDPVLISRDWSLPQLTRLSLTAPMSPDSDLSAALPALEDLTCSYTLAPNDLPLLPTSLTRLELNLTPRASPGDSPRFAADRIFRWTSASALAACSELASLSLSVFMAEDERGPGEYTVEVPEYLTQAAELRQLSVHVTRQTGPAGAKINIHAPRALHKRLIKEEGGFVVLIADKVVLV